MSFFSRKWSTSCSRICFGRDTRPTYRALLRTQRHFQQERHHRPAENREAKLSEWGRAEAVQFLRSLRLITDTGGYSETAQRAITGIVLRKVLFFNGTGESTVLAARERCGGTIRVGAALIGASCAARYRELRLKFISNAAETHQSSRDDVAHGATDNYRAEERGS